MTEKPRDKRFFRKTLITQAVLTIACYLFLGALYVKGLAADQSYHECVASTTDVHLRCGERFLDARGAMAWFGTPIFAALFLMSTTMLIAYAIQSHKKSRSNPAMLASSIAFMAVDLVFATLPWL